jgi:hypothetical protein
MRFFLTPHQLKSIFIRSLPAALHLTTASFIGLEEHHLIVDFCCTSQHISIEAGRRADILTAAPLIGPSSFVAYRGFTPCTLNWRHNHCISLDKGTAPDKP